ncbi:hypothetical protein [Desulfobulbus sp.]|uniref:hypothetical protein n=1 Tax=Desulfobulbus sp. TaxID=895 RepID=UPI0027B9BE0F|nr:hypothetical protein [Desulfobulbus sp.]
MRYLPFVFVGLFFLSTIPTEVLAAYTYSYTENSVTGGFEYDLTLFVSSDTTENIFDVTIDFDNTLPFSASTNNGWDVIYGQGSGLLPSFATFYEPMGSSIPSGDSLNGFLLKFEQRIDPTNVFSILINSNESATPASPVPVPGAALLLGSGLIGLAGLGKRRRAAAA